MKERFFTFFICPLLLGGLLSGLTSCGKNEEPGLGIKDLYGKWRWVYSAGGLVWQVHTPETTGEERKQSHLIQKPMLMMLREGDLRYCVAIEGDTLRLDLDAFDGTGSVYVRIRR